MEYTFSMAQRCDTPSEVTMRRLLTHSDSVDRFISSVTTTDCPDTPDARYCPAEFTATTIIFGGRRAITPRAAARTRATPAHNKAILSDCFARACELPCISSH